jgi:hypothetical protein
MIIFFRRAHRRRMIVALSLVLLLLGVRWGLGLAGIKEERVAKVAPLSQFSTSRPEVGLIVDLVSPDPSQVTGLLEVLVGLDIRATWFPNATWVESNSDMIKELKNRGQEIGIKGTDDKGINRLNEDEVNERIVRNLNALDNLDIEISPFFYPPQGKYSDIVTDTVFQLGYQPIKPEKDITGMRGKEESSAQKVVGNLKAGDVLMIRVDSKGVRPNVKYIVSLAQALSNSNLKIVGLEELTRGVR